MKFKVGDKLYLMGLEPGYEIISINEENNSWIGEIFGEQQLLPLNQIETYWVGSDIKEFRKYKLAEVKEYWKNK